MSILKSLITCELLYFCEWLKYNTDVKKNQEKIKKISNFLVVIVASDKYSYDAMFEWAKNRLLDGVSAGKTETETGRRRKVPAKY